MRSPSLPSVYIGIVNFPFVVELSGNFKADEISEGDKFKQFKAEIDLFVRLKFLNF